MIDYAYEQLKEETPYVSTPIASKETAVLKKRYAIGQNSTLIAPLSLDQFIGLVYPLYPSGDKELILQKVFGTQDEKAVLNYLTRMFDSHPHLKIGNCLATDLDLGFLKNHFSLLRSTDFKLNDPFVKQKINAFVNEKTDGMIPKIIDETDRLARTGLVAVNAGSFEGRFDKPFDPKHTKQAPFTMSNKEIKNLPAMWGIKNLRYYENELVQYVELPLENGSYHLQLTLPKEGTSIEQLLENDPFYEGQARAFNSLVEISVPKFTISDQSELLDNLLEMGIPLNSKTIAGRLSSVLQKTYFDMQEGGVKAAFVTAGFFKTSYEKPCPVHTFNCNRPFAFRLVSDDHLRIIEGIFNG